MKKDVWTHSAKFAREALRLDRDPTPVELADWWLKLRSEQSALGVKLMNCERLLNHAAPFEGTSAIPTSEAAILVVTGGDHKPTIAIVPRLDEPYKPVSYGSPFNSEDEG